MRTLEDKTRQSVVIMTCTKHNFKAVTSVDMSKSAGF